MYPHDETARRLSVFKPAHKELLYGRACSWMAYSEILNVARTMNGLWNDAFAQGLQLYVFGLAGASER